MKRFDPIKFLTAASIIFAFDFIVVGLVFVEIPEANREIFIHLMGIIEGAFVGGLVAYYYTKSQGHDDIKNNT